MPLFGKTVVHLDLKDFIELAKERKAGKPLLFDRLVKLVEDHKIAIPCSGMVIQEVLAIKDPAQRLAVAEVMDRLSNTFIIRSLDDIQQMEVSNAIADHFKSEEGRFDLKLVVFGVGYLEAIGHVKLRFPANAKLDPEFANKMEKMYLAELLKNDVLARTVGALTLPKIAEGGDEHRAILQAVEDTKKKWEGKSFHQQEKASILEMAEFVRKRFDQIAIDLDIRVNGLHPLYTEHFNTAEFLSSIPTLDVWDKLNLYLVHKDKTKKFDMNHLYDIAQLSVAVPYCDVVVCDKEMANVIRKSKVDIRYKTKVFGKLADAIEHLEAIAE